jgi:hypothetical protein
MTLAELLHFLRASTHGVEATNSPSGVPQAAVVGLAVTDRLEFVFDTLSTTRKLQNLRRDPRIALTFFDVAGKRTVSRRTEPTGLAGADLCAGATDLAALERLRRHRVAGGDRTRCQRDRPARLNASAVNSWRTASSG